MRVILSILVLLSLSFSLSNAQVSSMNVSLTGKLNGDLVLRSPIDDRVDKWILLTSPPKTNIIYENNKLLNNKYSCDVDRNKCDLRIRSMNNSYVGAYRRQGSRDTALSIVDFYVSLFEYPFKIECIESGVCSYLSENSTLKLKANTQVDFTAGINFVKYVNHTLSVEIYFKSNNESIEICNSNRLKVKTNDRLVQETTRELDMLELSKDCSINLAKESNLIVGIRYNDVNENIMIDEMDIKVEVHSVEKDENVNLTPSIESGTLHTLKCPANGYPIRYVWAEIEDGEEKSHSESSKELILSNLSPGTYKYKCTAFSQSPFYNYEKLASADFTVEVTKAKTTVNNKKPLIIGLSVGGGILVLLVVVIIAIVINKRKGEYEGPVPTREENRD